MKKLLPLAVAAALVVAGAGLLNHFRVIPSRKYTPEDFGISTWVSPLDADGDGVDDQTAMLRGVRAYLDTRPRYKSRYYPGGFPDDGCGVCTDVVAFGMLEAGYNLMDLVAQDVAAHPEDYDIPSPDPAIDFRRVRNLLVWFENNAASLTTDLSRKDQWQGGDIVIFPGHIGVVSDVRNHDGIPFLLHHASPLQVRYEEDALEDYEILGHFRLSGPGRNAQEQGGTSPAPAS